MAENATAPSRTLWAAAGRIDSDSELHDVNPQPPQRTGVTTAEDETGPQTLIEVNTPCVKMGAKFLSESS